MRFGSAFETTTGARIVSPPSSVTPSPGTMAATGTPEASTAPASRAASASRNDTRPMPPSTYPQAPGTPSSVPEACIRWIDAVPRIAWAGVGADEALTVQSRPQPFVAYITLDHVGDRGLEDYVEGFGVAGQELLELRASRRVADPRVPVPSSQGPPDPAEQLYVASVALGVRRRELGHGRGAAHRILPQGDGGPVGERAPQMRVHYGHPVPTPAQPQFLHDERMQQADQVGAGADPPALLGKRLLQSARPAQAIAPLQDQDPVTGPGQVSGRGQTVVTAADDYGIPFPTGQLGDGHRQAHAPQGVVGRHLRQPLGGFAFDGKAQVGVNLPRRHRTIERVEVQPRGAGVE